MSGGSLQLIAVLAALMLAGWLVVLNGVARTYGVPLMDGWGLFNIWWMFRVPFHLLAAAFLAGRFMSRSLSGRIRSSDRSR